MQNIYKALILIAFTATALAAVPAMADKGKGKSRSSGYEDGYHHSSNHDQDGDRWDYRKFFRGDDDDKVSIRIDFGDRDIIREYLRDDYRKGCPPGLAKKRNGCLPPGQAKKYQIGHRLPDDVRWYPIDDDLRDRLGRTPRGYDYVRVDKDILLIGEATKKVIDAVTLISAVDFD